MATNLHSLSSSSFSLITNFPSNVSVTSFTFQFPIKPTQFSCFSSKNPVFLVSSQLIHASNYGFSNVGPTAFVCTQMGFNLNDTISPVKKSALGRDLIVAKAIEANSEGGVASESKSSKKAKKTKYPRRILDVYQILQVPIITEAAIKNIADENSLIFTVDVRADKKMIREAITNFFGVKVRKVNTLIRPDGTKKAYIMLNREYNASELAKKIGIFPSSG